MKLFKHNPDYKLVSETINNGSTTIEAVYGESNDGENKGLELYFFREGELGHYKSYRHLENSIPSKWINTYNHLKEFIDQVPNGHKLDIN